MTPASSFAAPFLLLCAAGPACAGKMPPPLALLQGLHIVQDSVAHGEVDDLSIQWRLLEQLQASLQSSAIPDGVTREWEQAAIGYALSGAPSNIALVLLDKVGQNSDLKPIAAAIGLYLNGNLQKAAEQFQSIKVTDLPANLAPFVVIAHANSTFEANPEKSKELYRLALNLAPGTLIEELSLRRLTQISLEAGDKSEFLRTSKSYWRRYQDSPFSEKYISDYSNGITNFIQENASDEIIDISNFVDAYKMKNIISIVFKNFLQSGDIEYFKSTFSTIHKDNLYLNIKNDLYIFEVIYNMIDKLKMDDKNFTYQEYHKYSIEMIYYLTSDVIDQTFSFGSQIPSIYDNYYENSKSDDIIDANRMDKIDFILKAGTITTDAIISECENLK